MSVAMVGAGISAVGTLSGMVAGNKAQKAAEAQSQAALKANAWQGEIAKGQYDEYQKTYLPLERAMVADAQQQGTAQDYERAASDAQATSMKQIGLAQERLARTPGLDPSSGAAVAARTNLALQGAALGAVSQNAARAGVRDKTWARKMDALGLGKGLVASASAGAANSARLGASLAQDGFDRASSTASGVGSMVAGLGDALVQGYKGYKAHTAPVPTMLSPNPPPATTYPVDLGP